MSKNATQGLAKAIDPSFEQLWQIYATAAGTLHPQPRLESLSLHAGGDDFEAEHIMCGRECRRVHEEKI